MYGASVETLLSPFHLPEVAPSGHADPLGSCCAPQGPERAVSEKTLLFTLKCDLLLPGSS